MTKNSKESDKIEENNKEKREEGETSEEFLTMDEILERRKGVEIPSSGEGYKNLFNYFTTNHKHIDLYPATELNIRFLPSKEVKEKITKETNIEKLQQDIRKKQKETSITDTKILIVETFLKFIPPATATLIVTSLFLWLQSPIELLVKLIPLTIILLGSLIIVFYISYDIRCRFGNISYELNTEINESLKQIEKLKKKKEFDEIELNDKQQEILNFLYNRPEGIPTRYNGKVSFEVISERLNMEIRQTRIEMVSLIDYGLLVEYKIHFDISGKGINYLRYLERKNTLLKS